MTPAEILRKARALIDTPEKLARGVYARDAKGKAVPPYSPDAVCYCVVGAIMRVGGFGDRIAAGIAALTRAVIGPVPTWNDVSTHAEILAGFDRAIALAEAA